jgi:predicted ATP-binding protein involved in virulence
MRLDGEELRPSIVLTRKILNPLVNIVRNDDTLLKLKTQKAQQGYEYSVVAYYSGKRELDGITRKSATQADLMSAYADAFMPKISFSLALAWFIEKAAQEALEAKQKEDLSHTIPELTSVRRAVSMALGDFGEPFVGETPPVLFIPRKENLKERFRVEELSDGCRTMLALVMDLARRMAVANAHIKNRPDGETVLCSPGVVLIDEVELHLHPSWQQTVLPSLMKIFPKVQFIVTTHSPQVLTSIAAKHIRILKDNRMLSLPEETEGADVARVLEDVLGVSPRPQANKFTQKLNQYSAMVYNEVWDSQDARELRKELENHYDGSEPKLKELDLHIENSQWERGL